MRLSWDCILSRRDKLELLLISLQRSNLILTIQLQQIKALLESVGTSFCPDYLDWFGNGAIDSHSRNADQSVLSKFLQAHPADFSTTKLQVRPYFLQIFLMYEFTFPIIVS